MVIIFPTLELVLRRRLLHSKDSKKKASDARRKLGTSNESSAVVELKVLGKRKSGADKQHIFHPTARFQNISFPCAGRWGPLTTREGEKKIERGRTEEVVAPRTVAGSTSPSRYSPTI